MLVTLGFVVVLALWMASRPKHQRPCPESPDGVHQWMHETDDSAWFLRCINCRCKTDGWDIERSARHDPADSRLAGQ